MKNCYYYSDIGNIFLFFSFFFLYAEESFYIFLKKQNDGIK